MAEEKTSELKDVATESFQNEAEKRRELKKRKREHQWIMGQDQAAWFIYNWSLWWEERTENTYEETMAYIS